ncbi:MAG: 2-amino-4-hydroxy-6-hydroxymethyldihydropteridine diphosphokinase [Proteobacteria bacterium]|nr:2-amino-4-hydroxy-6-hydroxymethyldihydropteridine diphosphokinase [Pseudomonadota bacterium]
MILIGLGANLDSELHGPPARTLAAALDELDARGIRVSARSRWWTGPPDPPSAQPWYVNGVAAVATALSPEDLLAVLLAVEATLGRQRRTPNAARTADLDLLAYGRLVRPGGGIPPELPHPRMHLRPFVLLPLAEVAPGWRHPGSGRTVEALAASLPPEPRLRPL